MILIHLRTKICQHAAKHKECETRRRGKALPLFFKFGAIMWIVATCMCLYAHRTSTWSQTWKTSVSQPSFQLTDCSRRETQYAGMMSWVIRAHSFQLFNGASKNIWGWHGSRAVIYLHNFLSYYDPVKGTRSVKKLETLLSKVILWDCFEVWCSSIKTKDLKINVKGTLLSFWW